MAQRSLITKEARPDAIREGGAWQKSRTPCRSPRMPCFCESMANAVRGAIYYAADKRRVPVDFSEELFSESAQCLSRQSVAASGHCPPPLKMTLAASIVPRIPFVCRTNPIGGQNAASKQNWRDSFIRFRRPDDDTVRDQILEALEFAAESTKRGTHIATTPTRRRR